MCLKVIESCWRGGSQQQLCTISLLHNVKNKVRVSVQRATVRNIWSGGGKGWGCWQAGRLIIGLGRWDRDASYQNISMQSSGAVGLLSVDNCCIHSGLHCNVTHTCTCAHTHADTQAESVTPNRQQKLFSLHCLGENGKPNTQLNSFTQFVLRRFIYPVIDPCSTLTFSRRAYDLGLELPLTHRHTYTCIHTFISMTSVISQCCNIDNYIDR